MRILFDCRFIRTPRHDGVSRYTTALVETLGRTHDVEMLIADRDQLTMLPDLPWHLTGSPWSLGEIVRPRQIQRLRPDVVFCPLQTMGSWGRRYGLVLTLHDGIYHRHRTPPSFLPPALRLAWWLYHLTWWPQRLMLDRADEVVTVSQTTAALITEHSLTRRPVTVVPNAPGDHPGRPRPADSRERSLVYTGSFMAYKNVETLVRAAALLPGYTLHLVSAVPSGTRKRLSALDPRSRLVFHDGADDHAYRRLLSTATALVSASLDEGFGLPLVEAMTAGTPVVVSDIPAFREVCGEAGDFVDPRDPAAFAAAVRSLEDPTRWMLRSAASVRQAAEYDWTRSARLLAGVLERVAAAGATR